MPNILSDAEFEIVPVIKRYWWPHSAVRKNRYRGPWWKLAHWYADITVSHRYYIYGVEVTHALQSGLMSRTLGAFCEHEFGRKVETGDVQLPKVTPGS